MAKTVYIKTALTGGGSNALDGIDGNNLLDGDVCFVFYDGMVHVYELDADSGETEDAPSIIAPDNNAGDKRWVLQSLTSRGIFLSNVLGDIGIDLTQSGLSGTQYFFKADDNNFWRADGNVAILGNVGVGVTEPDDMLHIWTSDAVDAGDRIDILRLQAGNSANNVGGALGIIFKHTPRTKAEEESRLAGIYSVSEEGNSNSVGLAFYTQHTGAQFTEKMRITSTGNVGIGTTEPGAKLDVAGVTTADNALRLRAGDVSDASNGGSQILLSYGGGTSYTHAIKTRHHSSQDAGNAIDFYVWDYGTDAEHDIGTKLVMSLDGGNVGIGTTSPSARLHVLYDNPIAVLTSGGGNITNYILGENSLQMVLVGDYSTFTGNDAIFKIANKGNRGTLGHADGSNFLRIDAADGNVMLIDKNGNIGIHDDTPSNILTIIQGSATDPIADAWTTYSSRRWKTDLEEITNALDKVKQLTGRYFTWTIGDKTGRRDIGFIAEEVGEVEPLLVEWDCEQDEQGNYYAKALKYERISALLVNAIKELEARISALEAKLS